MSLSRERAHVSPSMLAVAFGLAFIVACKSEPSEDAASTAQAVGSAEPSPGGHKGKHQLPPAAFDVCRGKTVGDACSVQFGNKQIEATCAAMPDSRLACRRQHGDHKQSEGS